jgi:hypothetical protein
MASVVDTSVKHFMSSMSAAPVLNGTVGAMISVLDACLKDGFDLKTATSLVVAGGVATLTFSGTHSATVDSVVLVAGSSIAALNGEQKVTAIAANTVRFATAAADGTATGTITFKMAPLGWDKPFAGTNLAVYKSTDPQSYGMFLRVDDTATQVAGVRGYESMSAVSTGTGLFPTTVQEPTAPVWPKSNLANATAVRWTLIGDSRFFIIHVSAQFATNGTYLVGGTYGFGDPLVKRPAGDPWCTVLSANPDPASWTSFPQYGALDISTGSQPVYTARNFHGLGSSFAMTSYPYTGNVGGISGADTSMGAFPSRIDGRMQLSRRYLRSSDNTYPEARADVPGIYTIPHSDVDRTISQWNVVKGAGQAAGRSLLGLPVSNTYTTVPGTGQTGVTLVDITGPWR